MRHPCNAKQSGKSRNFMWLFSHTLVTIVRSYFSQVHPIRTLSPQLVQALFAHIHLLHVKVSLFLFLTTHYITFQPTLIFLQIQSSSSSYQYTTSRTCIHWQMQLVSTYNCFTTRTINLDEPGTLIYIHGKQPNEFQSITTLHAVPNELVLWPKSGDLLMSLVRQVSSWIPP